MTSKIAERRAMKAWPQVWNEEEDYDVNLEGREGFEEGYDEGRKDTIEQASSWWYEHIVGFLGEGLAKGVLEEFQNEMKDK